MTLLAAAFPGGVGDDDAADGLFALVEAFDDEAVVQRSDGHGTPDSVRGRQGSLPTPR